MNKERDLSMKKVVSAAIIIMLVFFAGVTALILAMPRGDGNTKMDFSVTVEAIDGELYMNGEKKSVISYPLEVGFDFNYELHVCWSEVNNKEPGFLTALLIKDEGGSVVSYVTGDTVDSYLLPHEMKSGKYTIEYRFYNDEKEFRALLVGLGEDISGEAMGQYDGFSDFSENGTWTLNHSFELTEHSRSYQIGFMVGACGSVFLGAILILVIVLLSKNNDSSKKQYDERQILARGTAFKAAFFTMFIYNIILCFLQIADFPIPMEKSLLPLLGIVVGTIVFVGYAIMNDAYFSLNQNKKGLLILFAALGILQTANGIYGIVTGEAVKNGIMTVRAGSLFTGIMFILLFVFLGIKALIDREEE